ncbi:hypothetical protein F2Q70_00003213 [Brassica cretica]|uniref:Uncharacterized protein n=1 Tax=Brassica cretica TaxID=69181 RepID=A0A8S9IM66_BRACR|nr:hypothetical protein F2Q70_00003213 [Brassica cretica]
MASSTRSNKETQLLFSLDPASLERSIRKEARSSSIDNNTCSSLDFHHPPSTQALVPSTNTRSPPSTKDTHLSSPNILHPTSIDTSVRTSINTELRDMVVTLILVRDERGDMHNQEGHLRNAAGQRIDAQGAAIPELSRASIDDTYGVNCILQCREDYDSRGHGTTIDRQPPAPIDRRAPLTYQVQMPKIDVARLNALRPKPKPSKNPPETARIPSDDGADPMEVDRVPMGRTLRKRKEKVALWMFFRETRETEEDIRRMFCEAREKMRKRITLNKKSDPGQFAIPCTVEPSKELFTFVDCSQRNSRGIARDLEVQIGNALVPVDFHILVHYNPIPVKKPQTSSRRINDPEIIAACHCGAEYETKYSASIETHTATSIDSAHQKSTDIPGEESVDSSLEDWENNYYNPTVATYNRHNMHTAEYDEDYEEERAA